MLSLLDDRSTAPFTEEEHELFIRTIKTLKTSRLRLPGAGEIDSGDLVDFFNHLALVSDIECLESPTWINWDITSRCNCSCIHCASDAVLDASNTGSDDVSTRQALEFIDEMASAKVLTVVLSGGEPFMRSDIYDIIAKIKQRGLFLTILTNASLPLDIGRLERLLDPNTDLIQISLDGDDAESHNAQRKADVFSAVVSNISRLLETSVPVKANMVITHYNIDKVYDVYHFVRRLGVGVISFTVNCPVGRGEDVPLPDSGRLLRISMNLQLLSERYPGTRIRNNVLLVPYAQPEIRELIEPDTTNHFPRMRCLAGTAKAVVDSRGDLYPCPFLLYPAFNAGNVFRQGLHGLWNHPGTWTELRFGRKLDSTKCNECGYLNRCRGECPGAAYGSFKTIHAPDSRCSFTPPKEI
ncbi:MAG: radical SAM protein [Prosthecochloris sp.]|nr:radical SAM protein [Prosthecochloris sp.]